MSIDHAALVKPRTAAATGFCLWPLLLGLTVGTAATALGLNLLRITLYGVNNLGPASYIAALIVLALAASISMLLPAARALRLNLASILHHE